MLAQDFFKFIRRKIKLIHELVEMDLLVANDLGNGLGTSLPRTEEGEKIILREGSVALAARASATNRDSICGLDEY